MSGSKSLYVKTFGQQDSNHIFDPVIDCLLMSIDTEFNDLDSKAFKLLMEKDKISLEAFKLASKLEFIKHRDLICNSIGLWSPVKALEYSLKYYDEKSYPAELINDFFKDPYTIKKIVAAGKQRAYTPGCILSILAGNCKELVYGEKDLSKYFDEQEVSNWIEVIKQYGMENYMKGFDTDFSVAVNNFYRLSNSWDHLRAVSFKNKVEQQPQLIPKDNNELFEIFGGNYDLIPTSIKESEIEDNKDAEVLITNKKLYNSYSNTKKKIVRAYLGQNIRKLNEAIKTASSVIFTALDTYNGTPDEKIESTIRESMTGGYYTNTDNLTSLHKQIKSAIESSVFRNVAECVDFVIHRYIPIMKQAKSNNTFKNLNETNFNKHGMEVFAGGNKILNESIEYEPVLDTDLIAVEPEVKEVIVEKPVVVEKVVEKPVIVEKEVIVEKAISRAPVYYNFTGAGKSEKQNSAKKLISTLVKIQTEFNSKFMSTYRKIIKFLNDVKSEDVHNDNINLLTFNSIDRILIKVNKTSYKISGIIEGKSFNKEYCEMLEATAQKLSKSKCFSPLSSILRELVKICESTRKDIVKARTEYIVSDKDRYDTMEIEISETKIPFDLKQDEIASLYDNFGRITMIIQERGNKSIKTKTEEILTTYIKTRTEKAKMIEEHFDRPIKTYETYLTKYDRLKPLFKMRQIIQQQHKKSFLWLNQTLDVVLAKTRLEQLKSKALSKTVIERISKNKIQFNPLERKEEIHKLNTKLYVDSVKREYFTSYFKIHNLCIRIINAYGVLDFMELLYKELEIVPKDFDWGNFKKGFMEYLVSMMIGIDVFQQNEGQQTYNFRIITTDLITNDAGDTNAAIDLTSESVKTVNNFKKYVIKACEIFGISSSDLGEVIDKDDGHITDARKKSYAAGFIKAVFDMVAVTNNTRYREAFGYSIRTVPGRSYIPKDFDMSDHTIKALYLPVLQVFDRFMKQRAGKDNLAFGNIDRLMMGGEFEDDEQEIEAGAIFDVIEPEEEDFVIIPEATKFYLVSFAIIAHYVDVFNQDHEKVFKPSQLSPLYMIESLKACVEYKPKDNDKDFEQSIKAFNKYWIASNKSFEKAYELIITDLNASLIFDQFGEDKDVFMKIRPEDVQKIFAKIITTINGFENTEFAKEYVEKHLDSSVKKMTEAKPETRKGLIKKIMSNEEEKTDKEFITFCETVLTPIQICSQYYINMLCKFIIDIAGTNFSTNAISEAYRSLFTENNYYKNRNIFTSSSLLLAHPEIIAENMTTSQVFEFMRKKYIDDMSKIIKVGLSYPTINEASIKGLQQELTNQYIDFVKAITESDLGINVRLNQHIKEYFDHNKFIPTFASTDRPADYPRKFIHYCFDNTFGFNPADFRLEEYYNNDVLKESSLTRYVCMNLANYTPNYYIPSSFVERLLKTKLFGSVFKEISPIVRTNRTHVANDQLVDLPIEINDSDRYLSIMVHIARSENAKSTCSSLTLSDNCMANLCTVIPFLINILKQYSVVCKDFEYRLGNTMIPVVQEAKELISLLKDFYNEIYKTSKRVQFGETVSGFENNGYFTTFVAKEGMDQTEYVNFADKYCRLGLTPTIHTWINRYVCSEVNYVDYNEFKSYDNEILNKVDDSYFTKSFKTIVIPILADLHFRTMASHIYSYTDYQELHRAMNGGMLGGAGEMAAKADFFDKITTPKATSGYQFDLEQFLLNSGIILKKVDGTENKLTAKAENKNIAEKIKGDDELGKTYEHKDDGSSFQGSFAAFLMSDVLTTLIDYADKNKDLIKERINVYISKHRDYITLTKDGEKEIKEIIVKILQVLNKVGFNKGDAPKAEGDKTEDKILNSEVFDTTYIGIEPDTTTEQRFRMSIVNFMTRFYLATKNKNYNMSKDKVREAADYKTEQDFYKTIDAFFILVNSVFPDVVIESIENCENTFLDYWTMITRANLRKINENSAMIDDTYETTGDNHVMLKTLDNDNLKINNTKQDEVQDLEANRNAFKHILTMDRELFEKGNHDLFDDIAELMYELRENNNISSSKRREIEQELTNLVLLREEQLYTSTDSNGLEYKSFLRYGTNLHNENLLKCCNNVFGTIPEEKTEEAKETDKQFISDGTHKLKLSNVLCLQGIAKPNDIFFGDNGSLGPIIRTIQLGHGLGDIPLNFDITRRSDWFNRTQYDDNSVFNSWYKDNKGQHYKLGEIRDVKVNGNDYKLTIEYQSLIEDSLSTLYHGGMKFEGKTKDIFNELVGKSQYEILGLIKENAEGKEEIKEKNVYFSNSGLVLNKKWLEVTEETNNVYGSTNDDGKNINTIIEKINFGINFLAIPNQKQNQFDAIREKAEFKQIFAKYDGNDNAANFNFMYYNTIDPEVFYKAFEIYFLIKTCKLSEVKKIVDYSECLPVVEEEPADVIYSETVCDFSADASYDKTGISAAGFKTIYDIILGKENKVNFGIIITKETIYPLTVVWKENVKEYKTIKVGLSIFNKNLIPKIKEIFGPLIERANIQAILLGNILNNYNENAKFYHFGYETKNKFDDIKLTLPNDNKVKVRIPKINVTLNNKTNISSFNTPNYNVIVRANYGYKIMQQYTKLWTVGPVKDDDAAGNPTPAILPLIQDLETLNPMLFGILQDIVMMIDNNQNFADIITAENAANYMTMSKDVIQKLFAMSEEEFGEIYKNGHDKKAIADKRLVAMYVFISMLAHGAKKDTHELFRIDKLQFDNLVGLRFEFKDNGIINFTEALPIATSIPSYCYNENYLKSYQATEIIQPGRYDFYIPEIYKYYREIYGIKDMFVYDINRYLHTIEDIFSERTETKFVYKIDSNKLKVLLETTFVEIPKKEKEEEKKDIEIEIKKVKAPKTLGVGPLLFGCVNKEDEEGDGKKQSRYYENVLTYKTDLLRYPDPSFTDFIFNKEHKNDHSQMRENIKVLSRIIKGKVKSPIAKKIFSYDNILQIYNAAIASQISKPMFNNYRYLGFNTEKDNKKYNHALDYFAHANPEFDISKVNGQLDSKLLGLPLRTRLNISKHFIGTYKLLEGTEENKGKDGIKGLYDINYDVDHSKIDFKAIHNAFQSLEEFTEESEINAGYYAYDYKDCGLSIETLNRIYGYKYGQEKTKEADDSLVKDLNLIKPAKADLTTYKITNEDDLKITIPNVKLVDDSILMNIRKLFNKSSSYLYNKYHLAQRAEAALINAAKTDKPKFFGVISNIVSKIKGIFVPDSGKIRQNKIKTPKIQKSMFGGFSLISGKGEDIIKHIYGDNEKVILATFLDRPQNVKDIDRQILAYFKNSMLTLTPAFDRHMFMEILYNSKLFDTAIEGINTHIDENPAPVDNVNIAVIVDDKKVVRDSFGIMKKKGNVINKYATAENVNAENTFETNNFKNYFGNLYKEIGLIDRYNGVSYHLIGYLKNLEYYDTASNSTMKYVQDRESNLSQF